MSEEQERRLALGLRGGDPLAWRELYDAFAERVWRCLARRLGPDGADVADVMQETFLAAAGSARGYDPERGSIWAWLWGIASRHAALHFRKQARHERPRLVAAALASPNGRWRRWLDGHGDVPLDELESSETSDLVRLTLARLPDEYERVLVAKYLDDQPIQRLAQEERCSETALRSRLARARQAFREAFGQNLEHV